MMESLDIGVHCRGWLVMDSLDIGVDGWGWLLLQSLDIGVVVPVPSKPVTIPISVAILRWVVVYYVNLFHIFRSCWVTCINICSCRCWCCLWRRIFRWWWVFWWLRWWGSLGLWSFCRGRVCSFCWGWAAAFRCLFRWLCGWVCRFCMTTDGGNLSRLLNGFHYFFRIRPPNYCQFLLGEVNIEIIYTCWRTQKLGHLHQNIGVKGQNRKTTIEVPISNKSLTIDAV